MFNLGSSLALLKLSALVGELGYKPIMVRQHRCLGAALRVERGTSGVVKDRGCLGGRAPLLGLRLQKRGLGLLGGKLIGDVDKRVLTVVYAGVVEGYADNPLYWEALARSIAERWEWRSGSKVLFSFHSVPLNDVEAGDTYLDEVRDSMRQVAELLGLSDDDWAVAYHSRFEDSRSWATPHPNTILDTWADEGVDRIALVTPGFASDCLESLYDIASVAKGRFEQRCRARGGNPDVTYIPALNHRDDHIDLLLDEIKRALR